MRNDDARTDVPHPLFPSMAVERRLRRDASGGKTRLNQWSADWVSPDGADWSEAPRIRVPKPWPEEPRDRTPSVAALHFPAKTSLESDIARREKLNPASRRATTVGVAGGIGGLHRAIVVLALAAGRLADLPENAIVEPMLIPPFDGIHRRALQQHREVQVIAAGEAGRAGAAELLAQQYNVTANQARRNGQALQKKKTRKRHVLLKPLQQRHWVRLSR